MHLIENFFPVLDRGGENKPVNPIKTTIPPPSLPTTLSFLRGILSCSLWPLLVSLPLSLTALEPEVNPLHHEHFSQRFDAMWRAEGRFDGYPNPLGLSLGICAVAVGQLFAIAYQFAHFNKTPLIQKKPKPYKFGEGVVTHLSQPEGFGLMVGYLALVSVGV